MQRTPVHPISTPQPQRAKIKPWPFLAQSAGQLEDDLLVNARRVIARTKAQFVGPEKQ